MTLKGIVDPIERVTMELKIQRDIEKLLSSENNNVLNQQIRENKEEEEKNELPRPIKCNKQFQQRAPFL